MLEAQRSHDLSGHVAVDGTAILAQKTAIPLAMMARGALAIVTTPSAPPTQAALAPGALSVSTVGGRASPRQAITTPSPTWAPPPTLAGPLPGWRRVTWLLASGGLKWAAAAALLMPSALAGQHDQSTPSWPGPCKPKTPDSKAKPNLQFALQRHDATTEALAGPRLSRGRPRSGLPHEYALGYGGRALRNNPLPL